MATAAPATAPRLLFVPSLSNQRLPDEPLWPAMRALEHWLRPGIATTFIVVLPFIFMRSAPPGTYTWPLILLALAVASLLLFDMILLCGQANRFVVK